MQNMEKLTMEYHRSSHGYLYLRLYTEGKTSTVYANRMGTSHLLVLLGREGVPVKSGKRFIEMMVPKYLADFCAVAGSIPKREVLVLLKEALSGKSMEDTMPKLLATYDRYDTSYRDALGGKVLDVSRRGYAAKLAAMSIEKDKDTVYLEYKKGGVEVRFVREENPGQVRDLFVKALKNPSGFLIGQTRLMLKRWYWSGYAVVLSVSGQPFVPSKSNAVPVGAPVAARNLDEAVAGKIITSIKTGASLPVSYLLS